VIRLSLAAVAAATGGRLAGGADPGTTVSGAVVIDSRAVGPGDLFVALPGERVDGHDYARAAVAAGAVAVLAGRETGVASVVVDDPQAALGALARAVVDRLPALRVVAVTGSSGKTSTKDLLRVLLSRLGPTIAPEGSFNNEIGAPLTALRADEGTRYLVAEMGARMPGNIAYLCSVTPPSVSVVLNVGTAHVGVFGSRDVIALTKGEIVEALDSGGIAVLNVDDPLVAAMAGRTRGRVVRVGESPAADVRATQVRLDPAARPRFRLRTSRGSADVALALHGEHHVPNALAAAAVAVELGLGVDEVAAGLSAAGAASRWRMEVTERPDGVTVVNDAYNANPDSVRAALKALAAMGRAPGPDGGRRRTWAVLGEMLELGEDSAAEHDSLGRLAVRLDISRLVAVGEGARPLHQGASHEGSWGEESAWVPDLEAALELLRSDLAPGDVVLVKASRSVGLERLAAQLLESPITVGGRPAGAAGGPDGAAVPPGERGTGEDDGQSPASEEEIAP
jgi:UDP-N-acetylmuramoyl-tripeptide--D-alanyl-D-alanine ligase